MLHLQFCISSSVIMILLFIDLHYNHIIRKLFPNLINNSTIQHSNDSTVKRLNNQTTKQLNN
jgi:hypothetical protein